MGDVLDIEEIARRAWESEARMIAWCEVGSVARGVLCAAVRLGIEAASITVEPFPPQAEAAIKSGAPAPTNSVSWEGPLFYPPVGKIAVTNSGDRIEVWPDESDRPGCFTGLLLKEGRTIEEKRVFDLCTMWDRGAIDHIEEPSALDGPLLEWSRFHTPPSPQESGR